MEGKKTLAGDIVSFYHGADAAATARAEWERQHSGRQDPTEIPEAQLPANNLNDGKMPVTKLLFALKLAASGNEARRLVQQGAVTIGPDREKITDPNALIAVSDGLVVRVGNRRIARIRLS
jgi:tyrosyl-tRNA synthetase